MNPSDPSIIVTDSSHRKIGAKSRVTLHFSLTLAGGDEIDSTCADSPATFEMGDGSLLPGFEAVLIGLGAGDDVNRTLAPEEAFGARRKENVQRLDIARFADLELEPGLIVSFAATDGELPGVITEINAPWVLVDFNHPLAGKSITFEASIVRVEVRVAE